MTFSVLMIWGFGMSRPLRIQYKGAWYHVMNRGGARQKIFCSEQDHQIFLDLLGESVYLWGIRVHAFSLLPNHYHLLVETPYGNLPRAMRHINGVYTQRFNRRWKRDGHLFRGRYRSLLVEEDAYLVELLRYIHLNPVRAKLARYPQDHPWTSHKGYLGKMKGIEWLTVDHLLKYFGKHSSKAKRKLHEFVMEGVPENLITRLESKRWPAVLSNENFKEWIESNFVDGKQDREVRYAAEKPTSLSAAQIRRILCDVTGKSWQRICDPKGLQGKEYRRMAVWAYRWYHGSSYKEISEQFGLNLSKISRIVNEVDRVNKTNNLWEHLAVELENEKVKT